MPPIWQHCPHVTSGTFQDQYFTHHHFGIERDETTTPHHTGYLKVRVPHPPSECRIVYNATNSKYRVECAVGSTPGTYSVIESSVIETAKVNDPSHPPECQKVNCEYIAIEVRLWQAPYQTIGLPVVSHTGDATFQPSVPIHNMDDDPDDQGEDHAAEQRKEDRATVDAE